MTFFGWNRSDGIRRLFRYIPYTAYESLTNKTDFIKVYKKERLLYPHISPVVNGSTGKYYTLPDIKAKSLKTVITQSRMKKGSSKTFKSEDVQLLLDIYKALDRLPVTCIKLSLDNIYAVSYTHLTLPTTSRV